MLDIIDLLQTSKGSKEQTVIEAHIEPYKSDNAKLVKENTELHHEYIKLKEESEATIRGQLWSAEITELVFFAWTV